MLLAFNIFDLIHIPFGWLLDILNRITTNYGVALILFALLVKLILLPATAKGKKSTLKMSRITPQANAIQERYANDRQKQAEALRELYKKEGVSMGGGCLWSFLPLLILIPLYQVVREPLVYILHLSSEEAQSVLNIIYAKNPDLFSSGTNAYEQMVAAAHMAEYADTIKAALPNISAHALQGLQFNFLGIDLITVPNVFAFSLSWAYFGPLVFPLLSTGSQLLTTFLTQRTNKSLVTDKNGVEDREAANKAKNAQSGKLMMWIMPIFSLCISLSIPVALSLYWFAQGIFSLVVDESLSRKYRKIYDAEDAERLARAMKEEQIEAEKELQRALKRAANPDGITQNTSKKKLQQQQKQAEEAAKAAAAKEYAVKKGLAPEDAASEAPKTTLSGVSDRPYCKGRAYDPNRYRNTTEE